MSDPACKNRRVTRRPHLAQHLLLSVRFATVAINSDPDINHVSKMSALLKKLFANEFESTSAKMMRGVLAGAAAGILCVTSFLGFRSAEPAVDTSLVYAQLTSVLPSTDPLLLKRASTKWGHVALDAAQGFGAEGVEVLDTFGDEAAYCLKHDRAAFSMLTRLEKLDSLRFRLSAGPWRRAVLDWAQNGRLDIFVRRLNELSADLLAIADRTPSALPLLLRDDAPTARTMLDQYGDRAWQLFAATNFAEAPAGTERVAVALAKHRELMLQLNEEFGLSAALLLVPPVESGASGLPEIVLHACKRLGPLLGVTLMLADYDDVARLLAEGVSVEAVCHGIDLLAAQPDFVRQLAVEEPSVLRLFAETWAGQPVGAEAFRRCGPAATIAYTYYGSDRHMSQAAVTAIGRIGWSAFVVFDTYREYGHFHDLLRRPELMQPGQPEPLVIDAIGNIALHGQEKIDVYLGTKNLGGQLMLDHHPQSDSEKILQWVPLYAAYRVGEKYANGLHVGRSELLMAGVDTALTLAPIKGAGKVLGRAEAMGERAASSAALNAGEKEILKAGGQQIVSNSEKLALEIYAREGGDLSRFGAEAGKIALQRLSARAEGLPLQLADRRAEYIAAARAGDLGAKQLIAEEIGMAGAEQYARKTGCEILQLGKARQGSGFDLVVRDGNRIKVIEAKGGSSPVKKYHGYLQGTPEYTREVAKDTLARSSKSAEEKAAAREVLKALDEKRLDIEVVRTRHVQGTPKPVQVESAVSVGVAPTTPGSSAAIKGLLLRTPGAATAFVHGAGPEGGVLAMENFIGRSQAMARRAGIDLWKPGAGPLRPRSVSRNGIKMTIDAAKLPAASAMNEPGEFGVAVMERSLQ